MMTSKNIALFLLFFIITFLEKCSTKNLSYGLYQRGKFKIFNVNHENEIPNSYVVKGVFHNNINTTGWGFLEINTNDAYPDVIQAEAAGIFEGVLTAPLIWMHHVNTMSKLCEGKILACKRINAFLKENLKWMINMVKEFSSRKSYWHQISLLLIQMNGIAKGYNRINVEKNQNLNAAHIFALNAQFDMEDLFTKMGVEKKLGEGHCSDLIKLLPDYSDIYISQVTWSGYHTMLRIQKKYVFKFRKVQGSNKIINGHSISFPSYPGQIFSGDDIYILSSGLVTLETTIDNNNDSLWKHTQPVGQVLEFIRSMVANRLASSGKTWTDLFKKYNSGTYNNQWMVVDYKRFKPGVKGKLKSGLLWILEQLPGITEAQDLTDHLSENSYWASYNLPYFPNIFNMSGTNEEVSKYGDWFTHDKHPRALIFKRDHSKVHNLHDMLYLMRYNDFKHDPLSRCECDPPYSGENAIAARNDLNLPNGTYPFEALSYRNYGATDVKITSYEMAKKYEYLAVSGPTYNESRGIPKFVWNEVDFDDTVPHLGHPNVWDFPPLTWSWELKY